MQPAPKITDVFAEHGFGVDRFTGTSVPMTFMFRNEAKTRRAGWVAGHKADGELVEGACYGEFKRLHLMGAAAMKQAA